MPDAPLELPYEGAKEMLFVENIEDRGFLAELFDAMVSELPAPKKKKKIANEKNRAKTSKNELKRAVRGVNEKTEKNA